MHRRIVFLVLLTMVAAGACAVNRRPTLSPARMAPLWEEPVDFEQRDLLYGPGGPEQAPDPNGRYTLVEVDKKGFSPGYDVRDETGREWDVKLGPEARTEVVVSRLVWAVGYRQPYIYYLRRWNLDDKGKVTSQTQGRFRLKPPTHENAGTWSWRSNPFRDTRELTGLFVLMVMVNNWDVKGPQNVIYRINDGGTQPREWYVVKDLGASLGKTNWFFPGVRDDLEAFEKERFIDRIVDGRVRFHYKGAWREPQLTTSVTPDDVRWVCGLLARLSPGQWRDAFAAGGYSEADAQRYIARMQEKIADGLSLD